MQPRIANVLADIAVGMGLPPDISFREEAKTMNRPSLPPYRVEAIHSAGALSESIDWARTLLALGIGDPGREDVENTLHVLLKHQSDIDRVSEQLAAAQG